ncbi:hypothetical protein BD770DRAFT_424747 [Pilaira anomala]|nr:hypothetical protein BD770DRAFT_424747 [Pilaira anomala]
MKKDKKKEGVSRGLVSHKCRDRNGSSLFNLKTLSRVLKAFLVLVLVLGLGCGLGLQCIVNRAQVDFTSYFQSRLLGPDVFPPSRGCCPVSIIVVINFTTLRTKRNTFFFN